MEKMPFGVLTMAFGPARYKRQAVALAQSLKLYNPGWPMACVTDDLEDKHLSKWFDILVPLKPELGKALYQKLYFDAYTPFKETFYIDSDCVTVRDLSFIRDRCQTFAFTPLCEKMTDGWWYMDVAQVVRRFRMDYLPKFNGGVYYFKTGEGSDRVFRKARQIARLDSRLSIFDLRGWFNEEPIYAVALGYLHAPIYMDDERTGMYTPAEFTDPFVLDVLAGKCSFTRDGLPYSPSIAHFFGNYTASFHYLREKYCLHLYSNGLPKWLTRAFRGIANGAYFLFVKLYQLVQALKGKKVRFGNPLPLMSLANFGTRFNKQLLDKL